MSAARPSRFGRPRRPRLRVRPADEPEMIRLYAVEGLTLAQVAARYGLAVQTVTRVLDRHGIARRPKGGRLAPAVDEAAVVAAYTTGGLTVREAAVRFRTSAGVITAILDARGVPRRGGTPPPRVVSAWQEERKDARRSPAGDGE